VVQDVYAGHNHLVIPYVEGDQDLFSLSYLIRRTRNQNNNNNIQLIKYNTTRYYVYIYALLYPTNMITAFVNNVLNNIIILLNNYGYYV
jgi:hypothetical protein